MRGGMCPQILHPLPSGGRPGNLAILLSWASSFVASRSVNGYLLAIRAIDDLWANQT
ncbi:hypothetical protein QFZ97_008732 [Paraburkholderia youngii]